MNKEMEAAKQAVIVAQSLYDRSKTSQDYIAWAKAIDRFIALFKDGTGLDSEIIDELQTWLVLQIDACLTDTHLTMMRIKTGTEERTIEVLQMRDETSIAFGVLSLEEAAALTPVGELN